jgi:hypothetical protein
VRAEDEGVLILRCVIDEGMKHYCKLPLTLLTCLTISACTGSNAPETHIGTDRVLADISGLCGQTFTGKVTSDDPQDEDWRKEILVLGPISCPNSSQVIMPLAVGENKSRTWFLTKVGERIEFRHQHLLDNGEIDPVSDYGGFSESFVVEPNGWRIEFPADAKTIEIFNATGLQVSTTNIWSFDYVTGMSLNYELNREGRHFRAEFDISAQR